MKKVFLIIIILNVLLRLNAQSIDGLTFSTGQDGPSPFISFRNNTVTLGYPKNITINGIRYLDLEYIENARYSSRIINGIYNITILTDQTVELYLLFNEEFGIFSIRSPIRYDSDILLRITDELIPHLPRGGGEPYIISPYNVQINTSSFLIENGRNYSGNNLRKLFETLAWSEGKDDAGIGEYIELDFSETYIRSVDTIIMSNGFFYPNNHNLYYQNNRLKRIRIEDMDGNYIQEFEVQDTPNLQLFRLNGFYSRIKITILEVYYGTEFNDTCINYLNGVKYMFIRP